MNVVVVFEPAIKLRENRLRVGPGIATNVVALERFDKRFGHAVGFRASNRRKSRHETKPKCEVNCFSSDVATAVVAKAFDSMRRTVRTEAFFDCDQQHITDHLTAKALRACSPCNDLAIARILKESDAHNLAIPACDFQTVRAPARVRSQRSHNPIVSSPFAKSRIPLEKQAGVQHDAVNAFVIDSRFPNRSEFPVEQSRYAPVAVGRALINKRPNHRDKTLVVCDRIAPALRCTHGTTIDQIVSQRVVYDDT